MGEALLSSQGDRCNLKYIYIFLIPVVRLFSVLNFFETGSGTFFGTKFFSRPVPGLFSVPNFFETGSETFFGTKFFRDRFRYHQKIEEFPGTGIPGTGMSPSALEDYWGTTNHSI